MVPTGGKALPGWVIRIRGPDSASAAHQRSACLQHQASCRIVALSKSKLPHASRQRPEPAQPMSSKQGDSSAATTQGSTRAASRHTVRVRARQRRSQRSPHRASMAMAQFSPHRASMAMAQLSPQALLVKIDASRHSAPYFGARQRRSQRSPHRASRATAQLPPPEAAHVPSLATPWCAPA